MAENLKSKDDENERKDKLEQMDSKLKYIKDLIIEEAMRYAASEDEADLQKVIFLLALLHISFIRIINKIISKYYTTKIIGKYNFPKLSNFKLLFR